MFRARFLLDIVLPALLLCWVAVLVYSAVASDTGYRSLARLENTIEVRTAEVEALQRRREYLAKRADLLNSRSLDPDMLDEKIRQTLGYSRDGDIIVSRDELDRAAPRSATN